MAFTAQLEKLLVKMLRSPQNVVYDDLIRVADALGVQHRQAGKEGRVFYRDGIPFNVSVPSKSHFKPVYVRKFVDLIWDLIPDHLKED